MPTFPLQATAASPDDAPRAAKGMVVCGDGALAHRLAVELRELYGETVTLVVTGTGGDPEQGVSARALASASMLLGRIVAAATRATGSGSTAEDATGNGSQGNDDHTPAGRGASAGRGTIGARSATGRGGAAAAECGQDRDVEAALSIVEAPELTETELARAGVQDAAAVALVQDDDETNIRAALAARRLNPTVRLVIRLYNRRLGQYLQTVLDQAAALATPGSGTDVGDASTTVLSDADTAAPALAATAMGGRSKFVRAGGLLLNAENVRPGRGHVADQELCTLALLSSTADNPAGAEGTEASGADGPLLLPDEATVSARPSRRRVVLTGLRYTGPTPSRRSIRLGSLLSKRLRWSFAGLVSAVLALAVASMLINGDHPVHAIYLTVLDVLAINDPAVNDHTARQILQLLSGTTGLLLLPVLLAAVLEALGSFRSGSVARRPPRGLSGHVVLLGLGKIGTRVLVELRQLGIPVVCVETDPEARGIAVARRLRVPVVLGDVTHEGVLESAKIHRAGSLLALTSLDTINLEAALIARSVKPDLRTVLRLYDDDFATAVFRTLRAAHPHALTRSRSVSYLAAPSFAAAMMGRQILGAIPVERLVLLFAVVDVTGHPQLEGHTIADASRPGKWRILALDQNSGNTGRPASTTDHTRRPGRQGSHDRAAGRTPDLAWDLAPGRVLASGDRVVLAATRQGLAELLGRRPRQPRTG